MQSKRQTTDDQIAVIIVNDLVVRHAQAAYRNDDRYAWPDPLQQCVKMMRWWADYLDDAKSQGAVIPMHAKQVC